MLAVDRFETARLRAEPIGPEHRDGLLSLLGDPRVGATLGGVADAAAVDRHIASMAAHWDAHGFGWYAFLDRDSGALVARGGPHNRHVAGNDEVEIGWTVAPERWNQGIATELGAASVEVAFGPLRLPDVVSLTLPGNAASRRVMEKLGFAFERRTVYKGWQHVLYRLPCGAGARVTGPAGCDDAGMDPEAAEVKASGGVVWRRSPSGVVELVVVHRPRYDDWSLPKGKLAAGETWERAALREVEEEIGLRCRLGDELPPVSYRDNKGRAKVVRYWLMEPDDGTRFSPNDEVDEMRWIETSAAPALLSYPHDVELVRIAEERI